MHPNFLTLAVLSAEEGRTVPPLAAPFVRLLLLKAVIKLVHERNPRDGRKLLNEALVLAKALIVSDDAVAGLLTLGVSEASAVVALRKHAGNPQLAASELLEEFDAKRKATDERKAQVAVGPILTELELEPSLAKC